MNIVECILFLIFSFHNICTNASLSIFNEMMRRREQRNPPPAELILESLEKVTQMKDARERANRMNHENTYSQKMGERERGGDEAVKRSETHTMAQRLPERLSLKAFWYPVACASKPFDPRIRLQLGSSVRPAPAAASATVSSPALD